MKIGIYPAYGFVLWRLAHVGNEVFELKPSRANLNPPATIIGEGFAGNVVTPSSHLLPDLVSAGAT
jgi:hypothetical protein